MFQEPGFSGSTASFLALGSTTAVSNSFSFSGSQSLQMDMQFVNATPTNWARISTFNTGIQPNPRILVRDPSGAPASISFYARMEVVPEPATLSALGAALGMGLIRRRNA
jgi:hypothetical protein